MLYFLCPDWNQPSAGCRKIYKDASILNHNGINACVLHQDPKFGISWFEHDVPTRFFPQVAISPRSDILVVPEVYGVSIVQMLPEVRKVIYNQNFANTFSNHSLDPQWFVTPYRDPQVIAVLCASRKDKKLLEFSFPGDKFYDIRYSVDPGLFYFQREKRRQFAYMTHKRQEEVRAVINMLKFRGNLNGFDLVPIENRTEKETAQILRDSYGFLSFSSPQGWSMVAAEAIACGCIVVGYYDPGDFHPDTSFHCQVGDLRQFVTLVETALREGPYSCEDPRRRASERVLAEYSPEKEADRVLEIWNAILASSAGTVPPKYSILIACYNNLDLTKNCVESIMKHSDGYQAIFIDNGSTDDTREYIRCLCAEHPRFKAIYNDSNLGFSKAVNQGVQASCGEYIVLLNNDTQVTAGWLEKLAAHCQEGIGAVGASSPSGTWGQKSDPQAYREGDRVYTNFLTFFCVMISRKAWDEVGELDERFFAMSEDLDWSLRARQAGYNLVIARDVEIQHAGGATFRETIGGGLGTTAYSDYAVEQDRILRDKWGNETIDRLLGDYGSPLAGKGGSGVVLRNVSV